MQCTDRIVKLAGGFFITAKRLPWNHQPSWWFSVYTKKDGKKSVFFEATLRLELRNEAFAEPSLTNLGTSPSASNYRK